MAQNPIPTNYPSLMVQASDAYQGAEAQGASIPLLINTATVIGQDLLAAQAAQLDYKVVKGGLEPLSATLRTEREAAYAFCFTARDLLRVYCGRDPNQGWLATGFDAGSLAVPRDYAGLTALLAALNNYFTLNPTHENAAIGITAALALARRTALMGAHNAILAQTGLSTAKKQARDEKVVVLRKRLSGLCKELWQRLEPLDPRWRDFGFNLPGAATVPPVPDNVVAIPGVSGQVQVTCDPSPTATHYRFFYQRPIIDPEPIFADRADDPLFIISGLVQGQDYLIYVSAVNEGAESELSKPANVAVSVAAAA